MNLNSEVPLRCHGRPPANGRTTARLLQRTFLAFAAVLNACAQDAPNEVRSYTNDVVSATVLSTGPRASIVSAFSGTAITGLHQTSAMTLPGSGIASATDCIICDSVPDGGGGGGGGGGTQPNEPDPQSMGLTPLEAAALQQQGFNPYMTLQAPADYLPNLIAQLPRHTQRYDGANATGKTEVQRQYLPSASGAHSYLSFWTDSLGRVSSIYVVAPDGSILVTNDFKWSATDSLLSYALYTNHSTASGAAIVISFSNDGVTVASGRSTESDGAVQRMLHAPMAFAAAVGPRLSRFGQNCANLAADVLLPSRANAQSNSSCAQLTLVATATILGFAADVFFSYGTPAGQALCTVHMQWCAMKTASILTLMGSSVFDAYRCFDSDNRQRGRLPPIQNQQTTPRQNAPVLYAGGSISAPALFHSGSYSSNLGWLTSLPVQRPDNSTVTAGELINQEQPSGLVTFGNPLSVYLSVSSASFPPIFDNVMSRSMSVLPPRY